MSAPQHPRWCAGDQCTDQQHRGRPVEIRTADGSFAPITVQLVQSVLLGDPYIVVAGEAGYVLLSLRQAKALQYKTRSMIRSAERGDR